MSKSTTENQRHYRIQQLGSIVQSAAKTLLKSKSTSAKYVKIPLAPADKTIFPPRLCNKDINLTETNLFDKYFGKVWEVMGIDPTSQNFSFVKTIKVSVSQKRWHTSDGLQIRFSKVPSRFKYSSTRKTMCRQLMNK